MNKNATDTGFAAADFRPLKTAIGVAKVCLVLGVVSGCSSNQGGFSGSQPASDAGFTGNTGTEATSSPLAVYRIKPGDQLSVNVLGYDNLSGNFPVSGNGQVNLPQLGPIAAADKSVNQLQNELVARYSSTGAVSDPKILVSVLGPQ